MKGISIAAIACLPLMAHGGVPDFDVKTYCNHIASLGGSSSQMVMQGCFQNEQAAYDRLKPVWDGLPQSTRAYCTRITKMSPSYATLDGCVDMESSAAQSNQNFELRK